MLISHVFKSLELKNSVPES